MEKKKVELKDIDFEQILWKGAALAVGLIGLGATLFLGWGALSFIGTAASGGGIGYLCFGFVLTGMTGFAGVGTLAMSYKVWVGDVYE